MLRDNFQAAIRKSMLYGFNHSYFPLSAQIILAGQRLLLYLELIFHLLNFLEELHY